MKPEEQEPTAEGSRDPTRWGSRRTERERTTEENERDEE